MKFQSLFLWNIYFNYFLKKRKLSQNSVSILIFMEHLLQLYNRNVTKTKGGMFQSLFLWNIYFNSP